MRRPAFLAATAVVLPAAVAVSLVGAPLALVGARLHDRHVADAPIPGSSDGA